MAAVAAVVALVAAVAAVVAAVAAVVALVAAVAVAVVAVVSGVSGYSLAAISIGGGSKTKIGNNCLFMISSHVAHDCKIGNNVIIANNVPLGGHVTIEDSVVIGGNSAVQQFTRIGRLAMIGGMTGVLKDVTPFGLSIGNRNYLQGLNLIGLRRKKYDNKKIMGLDKAYKEIFSSKNLHENLSKINGEYKDNELVSEVIRFIERDKKRPICAPQN